MSSPQERVWLVERTYSDDEQNLIILTYATPDGKKYVRKERALTSFDDERGTTASIQMEKERLADVNDEETQKRYAREVERMKKKYGPKEEI